MESLPRSKLSVDFSERTSTVKIMVDHFLECLEDDYVPVDDIGKLFAVERIDRFSKTEVPDLPIGELVFRVWKTLFVKSKISAESLTEALLDHRLPDHFQTCIETLKDYDKCPCIKELEKRGFPAIKWDIIRMLTLHFLGANLDDFQTEEKTPAMKRRVSKGTMKDVGSSRTLAMSGSRSATASRSRMGSEDALKDLAKSISAVTRPVSLDASLAARLPTRLSPRRSSGDELRKK
jgi:hypothetical protein